MLRVGVFCGTFAPIHNGHVAAAKAFMEQMKLDYLFVVPSNIPSHREADPNDDPLYRLKMCELAFEGIDGVVISDMDIRRGGISYIYDTLNELKREGTRLFLLCGTNDVLSFDTQYRYEDILKLCYPTYVRCEDDPFITPRIVAKIGDIYQKHGVMFRRIITDPVDISSARIRKTVGAGGDISRMVCPRVGKFIKENRLYID